MSKLQYFRVYLLLVFNDTFVFFLLGFSSKRTTEFIRKYVKHAKLVEESTTELTYQLPAEAAHSGHFESLFKELERCHKDMGISSFGISDTSLEEVNTLFIHVYTYIMVYLFCELVF